MVATVWGDGIPSEAYEIPPGSIINSQAASYLAVTADVKKIIDYTGVGGHVITLPPSIDAGNGFEIWIRNSGTGNVTIDPQGVDTLFNGLTTLVLAPAKSVQLILKGADYGVYASNGLAVIAATISVTPVGGISAVDVQAALAELDAEKLSIVAAQAAAYSLLGTVAGTVNAITAAATPALTAQAATGSLWKLPAAGANTGAVTLNINGQGAVAVVRPDGTALLASDIVAAGSIALLVKRAGDFVLLNPTNAILSPNPMAGIGYGTGAGGTANQVVNKAQPVTVNAICGSIVTSSDPLASNTTVTFLLVNAAIQAGPPFADTLVVSLSGGTMGAYQCTVGSMLNGSAQISIRNVTAVPLGETLTVLFAVIKGRIN